MPSRVGIPILAGFVIDTAEAVPLRVERWIATAVAVGVALGLFVAEAAMLARLLHGAGASWFRAFSSGPWPGPIGPTLLTLAGALACVAYGSWVAVLSRAPEATDNDAAVAMA